MNHVLVIDDDRVLVDLLREFLATEGFTVDAAYDYASGIARAVDEAHDLIVLDVMLPDGSGLELLKTLRASSKVPVLLLSAAGETADRIIGLQIGADDYLAKPFEARELAARVHAILRRTRDVPKNENEIKIGDLALSASRRAVSRSKIPVELTAVEFDLLECLLRNAGSIVTRETLAERALGRKLTAFDRSLDVHMHNLRKKISARTDERIKTIRGVGYVYASLPQNVE
ncbi:MAG TPA: response regulator transcription factor [Candidatus Acidoferrum sp.]|nr:response regulator transcription factor [Candidatus Acidoferrum sp.]